jgi:DNA-binding beta-propeller fold protein YncE/mono/diheme cytochrome c family protein
MIRFLLRALLVSLLLALVTCSSDSNRASSSDKPRVGQTRGSAVVLSRDERVAVVCNRSAGVITVFALDPTAPADKVLGNKTEIDLGPDWEPWAAVIGADDDTAYVISRSKQVVFRVLRLHTSPVRDDDTHDVQVGSEPTGIAIAPSGARVFVANWGEGTISIITTLDFRIRPGFDLNEPLMKTGVLGIDHSRKGLAHPRALAITDNGDAEDGDETLYATEFFSQSMGGEAPIVNPPMTAPAADAGPPNVAIACDNVVSSPQVLGSSTPAELCGMHCLCKSAASRAFACFGDPACLALVRCTVGKRCITAQSCADSCGETDAHVIAEADAIDTIWYQYCGGICQGVRASDGGTDASADDAGDAGDAGVPASTADASDGQVSVPPAATNTPAIDVTFFDRNRQGFIYPIKLSEGAVGTPIPIAPVLDTGFYDSTNPSADPAMGKPTSCFPNQLYAAAAHGDRLYVTSMCASPAGPLGPVKLADGSTSTANFKTLVHPSVFVVDTTQNVEVPQERVVLTQVLEQQYANDQATDRKFPLIPNDIVATELAGRSDLLLTALGTDALFRVEYNQVKTALVGSPGQRFADLRPKDQAAGRLPIGVAVSQRKDAPFALVVNDATQNLSVVDVATSSVRAVVNTTEGSPTATALLDSRANQGRTLFATGLGSWSFKGEGWLSCESCHPDGLSDGLTWFFARGPRRTISTANTYDGESPQKRRVMLWTGNIDEVHDIEAIVRTVAGGTGVMLWNYPLGNLTNDLRILYDGSAVPKGQKFDAKPTSTLRQNLNGSLAALIQPQFCPPDSTACDSTQIPDWNDVDAYIRTVRAPRAPTLVDNLQDPAKIEAGKKIFDAARCAGCHAGPNFTLSRVFYTPGPENNGALPYTAPPDLATALPSLLGRLRTVTYDVPPELAALNPPGKSGNAPLRRWNPGTTDPVKYAYDAATATNDQINCVLRDVGTFPVQVPGTNLFAGIGKIPVLEVRQDMKTLAVGASGFNIPTLIGLSTGAPYFHAGNARTLEEVFDPVFEKHYRALSPGFPLSGSDMSREEQVDALVAYLLSLDDSSMAPADDPEASRDDLCARAATPLQ